MSNDEIILKEKNGIAIITFNRPSVHNALNNAMVEGLERALLEIKHDGKTRVLILTGAGEKSFLAGSDIEELSGRTPLTGIASSVKRQGLFNAISELGIPSIAAINGYAFGGGCEIAMACTFRFASERAKMGQLEINLGIIPGAGGTQRLSRLIGKSKAAELILTGKIINAEEAFNIGLVDRVVSHDKLMDEYLQFAKTIAEKSSVAVKYALRAINEGIEVDIVAGLRLESLCLGACYASEDGKEGLKAFMEKRKPKFVGR
jgi:enoyl-CoA hydratase